MDEQKRAPYVEALKKYLKENISPFDVPGHHMGNISNDFIKLIGEMAYKADVNAPRGLDNLNHPNGVIKEAQELMAKAYKADEAFFLVNGTSSGIHMMILSTLKSYDKIILPRNCHKSAINALMISGALPIFITPQFDDDLEIANQPSVEDYIKAMDKNPDTKAIFVINPTYFGAALDLTKLVKEAHKRNILVLVDEAHGAHFGFNYYGPNSAMEADADMSAVSFHKCLGSLTQSSILLRKGNRVSHYEILKAFNILNTTSPSTLLIASLDAARKYMAINGQTQLNDTVNLANYARNQINRIPGFKATGRDYFLARGVYDYDDTKLVIELDSINLTGFELYNMLKDEYHIQMELAEAYTILGIIAIGSKKAHIDNLINALKDISSKLYVPNLVYPKYKYKQQYPIGVIRPRTAYHAPLKIIDLNDAVGEISKESIMVYPPGIPLIIPGEMFTKEIIDHINYYYETGARVLSDYDNHSVSVIDLEKWETYSVHKDKIEAAYEKINK